MTSTVFNVALQVSVIACGLIAGVFLTFSDFVMRSLGGAQTTAGVEVMQVINREVYRSIFMILLLAMSALSPVLAGYGYYSLAGPAGNLVTAGGAIYFVGVFLVTMVFNAPMNKRLGVRDHAGVAAAAYWSQTYMPRWTFWNTVRAASSAAAAVCFLMAGMAAGL